MRNIELKDTRNSHRSPITSRRREMGAVPKSSSLSIIGVGLLDSFGFLQYYFNLDQLYFYLVMIFIKIVLFFVTDWNLRSVVPSIPLLGTILFGLFISSGFNSVELIDVVRVIMAALSIILTLIIIDGDFKKYSFGLAINGLLISLLYILEYQRGSVLEVFGRYYFFNETHPNLGGEILSVIVILSTASLRPLAFYSLFAISSYCCWLLQSRTSIMAMILTAILYASFWIYRRFGKVQATLAIVSFAFFGIGYAVIDSNFGTQGSAKIFDFFYNSVFLVENSYRGAESGFSGRDLHWNQTLEIIDSNFFFGAGIEYPVRLEVLQPHNWFLYPVALFGLVGYFVIVTMLFAMFKILHKRPDEMIRIVPIFVMLLLNDRFMSLNISPLGIYVYIFSRLYKPDRSFGVFANRRDLDLVRSLHARKLRSRARSPHPRARSPRK